MFTNCTLRLGIVAWVRRPERYSLFVIQSSACSRAGNFDGRFLRLGSLTPGFVCRSSLLACIHTASVISVMLCRAHCLEACLLLGLRCMHESFWAGGGGAPMLDLVFYC